MAGFGRREIEYMQALSIYEKYTECYSVIPIHDTNSNVVVVRLQRRHDNPVLLYYF